MCDTSLNALPERSRSGTASTKKMEDFAGDLVIWFSNEVIEGRASLENSLPPDENETDSYEDEVAHWTVEDEAANRIYETVTNVWCDEIEAGAFGPPGEFDPARFDAMLEVLFEIVARNLLSHGRELRTLLIKVIDFSTDGC
jgi:hypothetical protein